MRAKAIFSVFGRKLPSGKRVYYYHCYDEKGKRQWAKSTGLTKKTEATAYVTKLYRDGLLIPEAKAPVCAEFSFGWWNIETCRYLKWRQLHDPLAKRTIYIHKCNFTNHIKDYYAKYNLDEITPNVVEGWLLSLSEKGLKPKTINLVYITFKTMMKEALKTKLIKTNPCSEVKKLKSEEIVRDILSVEETHRLFPADWSSIWDSKLVYRAHWLASCTGLRIGELMGLRGEYVFDDYLFITGQYNYFGYSAQTKTKHNRDIPITSLIRQELEELLQANGDGFVFSENGGGTPVAMQYINRGFYRALERIGIDHDERIKRKLSFHTWRHFFNTLLRMSNVPDSKVQKVTGHLTKAMTERYTHFDTRQFTEIRDVQAELLAYKEPEKDGKVTA
jgi:integrase